MRASSIFEGAAEIQAHVIARRLLEGAVGPSAGFPDDIRNQLYSRSIAIPLIAAALASPPC